VTLSATGGTSASTCVVKIQEGSTVNSYNGIKAGTSSKAGAVVISVPSGTKYLHLHAAAWSNNTIELEVSPSGYSANISLTADSGISNNSPFTLAGYNKASTDYYKVITFESALAADTDLTFTAIGGKRFVVWGVTAEDEGSALAVATSVVISDKAITNTDVHVSDEAGSLTATVVAGEVTLSAATVTWSGDNDAVATIDASTGAVTLVGAGVVNFTAAYAGVPGEYKASSATYEMTVTDSTPFTGGDVTFDATADKGNTSQGTGSIVKHGVTFACDNGVLGNGSEYRIYKNSVTTFTLSADAVASGYVIKSIAFTCTGSNPASGFADQEGWTTEGSNGTWTGVAASVSFTASGAQVRATEIVVTVGQQAALASIEVSGDYPTSFHAGDAFSHEGIVVTATYEDASTRDVTASATFSEPDMTTMGVKTVTVSYSEGEVTKTATYDITVNAPATLTSIALSGTYPTEFQQGDAFSSEGIVVTAYYDDNTTSDVTANAAFSGYDMDVLGEQTVTVSYEGQTATYTITIVEKKGVASNPYTVAEAIAFINTLGSATSAEEVYVSGVISQVDSYSDTYHSIQYWISDDGTTTGQMEVYSGKGLNGADFSSIDDLKVGDIVTVKGYVKMYKGTPEFDKNNELVSLDRPVVTTPSINLGDNIINASAQGTDGVIIVGYENITNVAADVFFCDADGNAATYDWLTASINSINNLVYVINENTSTDARTAYMKVHALDDDANDVYSELITINQAGYVAPVAEFATLPFSFDGGKADIETTDGLTQEGLDSDYGSSPKMKFNGTGDYLVLAFDERPGKLTFDIKGNSFSDGTFTVQTSEDGVTYTDLETYTELGTTHSEEFDDLGENVRYIKWIYTEKVNGNVALGNIELAAYTEPVLVASITVDPATVDASAAETYGALELTYANFTVSGADDFDVQFYDGEGNELQDTPDWVDAKVEADGEGFAVSYILAANDGEARTAYFKVYAMDDETNLVYSNLVTVNQAEYVVDYATLPFTWEGSADDGKSSLEAMAGVTANSLGSDYAVSNAPYRVKLDGTGDYIQVKTDCQPVLVSLDVKMLGGSNTSTITVQESADGETFADVEELTIEGIQNDVLYLQTASAFDTATRYVRIFFTKGSNVGVGNITIEKTFEDAVTVGETGYATYVTKHNVSFPAADVAYIGTIEGNFVKMTPMTYVPKGTPLIIKGEGTYTLTPAAAGDLQDVSNNDLKASETDIIADGKQYILAKPENKAVGFYLANTGTTIFAGKAYIEIENAGVKAFTFFYDEDDPTGIETIEHSQLTTDQPIYNVAGQRISKMQKGINIVSGKKILK
jgi:hypothetical protein